MTQMVKEDNSQQRPAAQMIEEDDTCDKSEN
jgi:hypothetical protein